MKSNKESFLEIDPLKLDEEWVNQPMLYNEHAKALAEARRELDRAKSELDLTVAELDQQIRADPEEYDLDKPTEPSIKQCIITQKEYKAANDAVIDERYRVAVLEAATTALDHRKRALENLVDLHGQNYFASPRAPQNSRENMEAIEERALRQRGQRKRRRGSE